MSKTLWHTIKIEVPKEMVNITKNDKVVVKKTLTKTNNISKANKEPSIKIIPGDTNKPKIIDNGKEWNIEELKFKMKKANELGKKNEGKELKKKSDNKILKSYVKKVNDKIVEKKNIVKPIIINEEKPKSDIDKIIDEWDKNDLPKKLYYYDSDVYDKIQIIVTREIKRKHFIMPFDLLVFTKKYNNKVVEVYSKNKNYKEGMDILYKGIYTIINNIINQNNIKIEDAKILNVFEDRNDYNMAMKYINAKYAYKIMEMNQKELKPNFEIKIPTPITNDVKKDNEITKVQKKPRKKRHPFINYDD